MKRQDFFAKGYNQFMRGRIVHFVKNAKRSWQSEAFRNGYEHAKNVSLFLHDDHATVQTMNIKRSVLRDADAIAATMDWPSVDALCI